MALLDTTTSLDDVEFAATNSERLSKYVLTEVNICAVVDRQVKADAAIQSLTESGDHSNGPDESATGMKVIAASLDKHMSTMNNNIQKLLDHLNAICLVLSTQHSQAIGLRIRQEVETKLNPPDVDRSLNVDISDVDKDKDSSV